MGLFQSHAGHDGGLDGGPIASKGNVMTNLFTAHPSSVGETYAQHGRFALLFGARMTLGGLAAMAHALFPFLFVSTASRALDELNALRARGVRPPVSPERLNRSSP